MTVIADAPGPVPFPGKPVHTLPPRSCDTHAHIFGPADRYPYHPDRNYTPLGASRHDYASHA